MRRTSVAVLGWMALAITLLAPAALASGSANTVLAVHLLHIPGMNADDVYGPWHDVANGPRIYPTVFSCLTGRNNGYALPGQSTFSPLTISDSAAPPAPSGSSPISWGFAGHSGAYIGVLDAFGFTTSFAAADAMAIDVYGTASGAVHVITSASQVDPTTESWAGSTSLPARPTGAWSRVTVAGRAFHWTSSHWDPSAGVVVAGPSEDGTLAEFQAAHPDQTLRDASMGFGCDGANYRVQNINMGDGTVLELGTLHNYLSRPASVWAVAGKPAWVGSIASLYVAGPYATLLRRPVQKSTYVGQRVPVQGTSVNDFVCTWGPDSLDFCATRPFGTAVTPTTNEVFRFGYSGTNGVEAAYSGFATIHVMTALSPVYPPSITAGQAFAVRGTTYPAKPGSTVTLWAKSGTALKSVGTGAVNSRGEFKFLGTLPRGTWSLYVTIPKDSTNEAAKSISRTYSVG